MLKIRPSGVNLADAAAGLREAHRFAVPFAASTALTRTAHLARTEDLPAAMRAAFGNPRPYTLNSLFVENATAQKLSARILVKNYAAGSGQTPGENYLLPQTQGGVRRRKGFEQAMRAAGHLRAGEHIMPGGGVTQEQAESGTFVRDVLQRVMGGAKGGGRRLFVGAVGRGGQRGIWEASRSAKKRVVRPLFVFVDKDPAYRKRLDFQGVAEHTAQQHFPRLFYAALDEQLARRNLKGGA